MEYQHTSRWPVIIVWLYFLLFPVSLLQSVVANPTLTNVVYGLKGVLVLWGFLYIFLLRKKVVLPALGITGLAVSIVLNLLTVNKFVIDIWVLYFLCFLVYNLSGKEQRSLTRYCGWTYLLTPFVLVLGTVTGLIRSDMWFTDEGLQFSFGLANPNYFMFFFLYACFCWMLLRKKILLLLTFAAACAFYVVTETRSVLYCGLYIILMLFCFDMLKRMRFRFGARAVGMLVMLLINVALLFMLIGYSDIMEKIAYSDSNLRSRVIDIIETTDLLKSNPQVLFFGGHEAKLDNMYLNLISALGMIHFIFLWMVIQYCLLRNILSGQFSRFILISCMLLIGFIEHGLYSTILPSVLVFVFMVQSRNVVFKGRTANKPALA